MKIMITGSTGFVGKKLMKALLQKGYELYPLVRSEKKIREFLAQLPEEEKKNVFPIMGDIQKPELGIDKETQENLVNKIDIFYHTAAFLSFNEEDREKSFQVNVEGTRNALSLAKTLGVTKFFHVSTAYTLGKNSFAEETLHDCNQEFVNSYEESKCRAEHLVWSQKEEIAVSIFRPGIIIGDSITGEADTSFALYGLMRAISLLTKMAKRGKMVLGDRIRLLGEAESDTNLVPVNYVTDVLAAGAEHACRSHIYHITNNQPPKNKELFTLIKQASGLSQLYMVPIDCEGTLKKEEVMLNEPMKVFHSYLSRSVLFDDRHTQQLLKSAGLAPLSLGKKELTVIVEKFFGAQAKSYK